MKPFVILIAGASGSGKTTLADSVVEKLIAEGIPARSLSMDDYYKSEEQRAADKLNRPGQRAGCNLHFMTYEEALQSGYKHGYFYDGTRPDNPLFYISSNRDTPQPVPIKNRALFEDVLDTLIPQKLGTIKNKAGKITLGLSADELNQLITTNSDHKPTTRANLHNFDEPRAFDQEKFHYQLKQFMEGKTIHRPTYDFPTQNRLATTVTIKPEETPVLVVEGLFTLDRLEELAGIENLLTVFIQADAYPYYNARRAERDEKGVRKTSKEETKDWELLFVRNGFFSHILPTQRHAMLTVHNEGKIPEPRHMQQAVQEVIQAFKEKAHLNQAGLQMT